MAQELRYVQTRVQRTALTDRNTVAESAFFGDMAVLSPGTIASAEAFGAPQVETDVALTPASIASSGAFGTPVVTNIIATAPSLPNAFSGPDPPASQRNVNWGSPSYLYERKTDPPNGGQIGDVANVGFAGNFYKVGNPLLIRQAARILVAETTVALPVDIAQIIVVSSTTPAPGNQFDAQPGWQDFGVTRGGVRISRSMNDDGFTINASTGIVQTMKTMGEVFVEGALADMSLERMAAIWRNPVEQLSDTQNRLGAGLSVGDTLRRVAVLQPLTNPRGIRAYIFPITEVASAENSIQFVKSGEQQSVSFKFRSLADPEILRLDLRHLYVLELKY